MQQGNHIEKLTDEQVVAAATKIEKLHRKAAKDGKPKSGPRRRLIRDQLDVLRRYMPVTGQTAMNCWREFRETACDGFIGEQHLWSIYFCLHFIKWMNAWLRQGELTHADREYYRRIRNTALFGPTENVPYTRELSRSGQSVKVTGTAPEEDNPQYDWAKRLCEQLKDGIGLRRPEKVAGPAVSKAYMDMVKEIHRIDQEKTQKRRGLMEAMALEKRLRRPKRRSYDNSFLEACDWLGRQPEMNLVQSKDIDSAFRIFLIANPEAAGDRPIMAAARDFLQRMTTP